METLSTSRKQKFFPDALQFFAQLGVFGVKVNGSRGTGDKNSTDRTFNDTQEGAGQNQAYKQSNSTELKTMSKIRTKRYETDDDHNTAKQIHSKTHKNAEQLVCAECKV
eukprot:CCRYP_007477-RD/>CCRYP_007477-RD protein AED:0.47 eAED:1.00 QI:0/0/0/1/0/0/2/0/108